MILALQTTTFGAYGGIPTYNRVVSRALNAFGESCEKRLMIATDSPADLKPRQHELSQLMLRAFSGNRRAFVAHALKLALTTKIDMLLIGHVNYAPLGWLMKRLQPSLRYGVMVHGVDVWSRLSKSKRRALKAADFITSVSQYTKHRAAQINGLEKTRIYLLPNALEWNDNKTRKGDSPLSSAPGLRLLSVCRLDEKERYKGIDSVIEALPSLRSSIPNIQYFVIGSGSDLERHRRLAQECSVSQHVHFLGSVDTATLQAAYQACDVFVMPSAGEGFGIVFLEAMQYSKPVIAADSGAVSEVIQDQVTGLLVKYGDPVQIAGAINRLASDPTLRHRLGQAGYKRLQHNFTFQHFQRRFTEILQSELSSSARSRFANHVSKVRCTS